jgi:hypothetical protein
MLYGSRGMPKSYADHLTETYGPEGIGWAFETDTTHTDSNELERAVHEPEFKLASEGMRNVLRGQGYISDEGLELSGRIERRARRPDIGNVVLYPDGKVYYAEKHGR